MEAVLGEADRSEGVEALGGMNAPVLWPVRG